jgi:hypothetical protein
MSDFMRGFSTGEFVQAMTENSSPAAELTTLLNFTPGDLDTNRSGKLSPSQEQKLQALQSRALMIGAGVFFALALLATMFLFGGQTSSSGILTLIGFLLTGLNAVLMGMFGRQWMRLNADLRGDSIDVVAGKLERILRPTGRINNYIVRVNNIDFAVNKDTFKAFTHEAPYRLYRTRHSHILLSVEPG